MKDRDKNILWALAPNNIWIHIKRMLYNHVHISRQSQQNKSPPSSLMFIHYFLSMKKEKINLNPKPYFKSRISVEVTWIKELPCLACLFNMLWSLNIVQVCLTLSSRVHQLQIPICIFDGMTFGWFLRAFRNSWSRLLVHE